jgi:hypothetical protein
MFEYNEDYLRQRIRDLQEEYKHYTTQPNRTNAKKNNKTSNFKKIISYIIYLIG